MIFLTDGRTYLGPYSPDEIRAQIQGRQTLKQIHGAADVYAIAADNQQAAQRAFTASRKDK